MESVIALFKLCEAYNRQLFLVFAHYHFISKLQHISFLQWIERLLHEYDNFLLYLNFNKQSKISHRCYSEFYMVVSARNNYVIYIVKLYLLNTTI